MTRRNTRIPQDSHTLPQASGMPYSRIPVVKHYPISCSVDKPGGPVVLGGSVQRDGDRVPVLRCSSRVPVKHEDCAVKNKLARAEGRLLDNDASTFSGAPGFFVCNLQMGDDPNNNGDGAPMPHWMERMMPRPDPPPFEPLRPGKKKRDEDEDEHDQGPSQKRSKPSDAQGGARKKPRKHSRLVKRKTSRARKPHKKTRARKREKKARSHKLHKRNKRQTRRK